MSTAYTPETPAIAAWVRAGERAAESVQTAPYSEARFRVALERLRALSRQSVDVWSEAIERECAAAGVAVVFVPELPKTRCHATCWWASRTRAVIELSLRYKTADQVWFSLYHEAGHLLLDNRRHASICDLDKDPAIERQADAFAADMLIPPDAYAAFLAGGRPIKARTLAFAEAVDIAPGIVVGRLQREGIIPHRNLNDLKERLAWG